MNLPNRITVGRLFLAVIFCVLLSQYDLNQHDSRRWLLDSAFAVFVIAALSDIVDGYLARKHNLVTSFGRVVDPFVDKILVIGAFMMLAGRNFVDSTGRNVSGVESWMVIIILGREMFVTSLRGVAEAQGKDYGANVWGKVKMLVQSITVSWVLLGLAHPSWKTWGELGYYWVWATVLVTSLSLLGYLASARRVLSEKANA